MFQVQEIDEQYLRGILIKGIFLVWNKEVLHSPRYCWKYVFKYF